MIPIEWPQDMITQFITQKLNQAHYKLLKDSTYFGEIPALKGVWANAETLETCREELREVLEAWLVLKLRSGGSVSGFKTAASRIAHIHHV